MKTQIKHLRSGSKNQVLNPAVDYSQLPKATSHIGHAGSSDAEKTKVWEMVKSENADSITFAFLGQTFTATANYSISGKSVTYTSIMPTELFEKTTGVKVGHEKNATISIQGANTILLRNGKNYECQVCPSLIDIL
jgi:hypothetical protein